MPAVAAAAVVAVILATGGVWEHVGGGDLHGTFLPKYEAAAHAILVEHRVPLWNPYEFCGLPLLGSGQGAVLYPPVWLAFGTLPRWAALQAFYAFHVALLAWGAARYLRRHAIGSLAAAAVPFVAVAGLFAGPSRCGYDHPSFVASVAWVPWILLAAERAVADGLRPWAGWLAAAAGMQWLTGYPDFPMDVAPLVAVVVLAAPGGSLGRKLAVVVVGLGVGAALGAVQILPLAEAARESPRALAESTYGWVRALFAVGSPADLARQLVARHGVAALVVAAAALIAAPSRAVVGWAAALAWTVFALNPPFVFLYRLPPFASVRFPFGWSGIEAVLLSFLVAAGIERGWRRGGAVRMAAALALLVVAGESVSTMVRVVHEMAHRPPDLAVVESRVARLRELGIGDERFVGQIELAGGAPLRHRLATPSGYEPAVPPRRVLALLEAAGLLEANLFRPGTWRTIADHAALAARLGIGWVVAPPAQEGLLVAAGFTRVGELPGGDVVLRQRAVPRARLVHRALVVPDDDAARAAVVEHAADIGQAVLLADAAPPAMRTPEPGAEEHVAIAESLPERVAIDVDAAAPGLVVLADTAYPGWEASVDGVPAPVLEADATFRAVAVDAGHHRVELRYRPRSVGLGATASLAALVTVAALVLTRPSGGRRALPRS
jgi:hypothetical protein